MRITDAAMHPRAMSRQRFAALNRQSREALIAQISAITQNAHAVLEQRIRQEQAQRPVGFDIALNPLNALKIILVNYPPGKLEETKAFVRRIPGISSEYPNVPGETGVFHFSPDSRVVEKPAPPATRLDRLLNGIKKLFRPQAAQTPPKQEQFNPLDNRVSVIVDSGKEVFVVSAGQE